jgi:hypothetical protein
MKLLTFIIAFSFTCSVYVPGFSADNTTVTKAIVLQAELKNNPTKVPVFCKVVYEGESTTEALIKQGNSVLIKQKLRNGNNDFFFFAQANKNHEVASLKLIVNDKTTSIKATTIPFRKWRVNFVQHTHTDIGYTRPQSDILAEHLRFIDYALDYCDQTDNLPDASKFRWTCEVTWPVEKYLISRPQKQIDRLKQRVEEGRIELAAMYLNFDEMPDEQTYAASLKPFEELRKHGLQAKVAMQNDVNGIGWCFNDYYNTLGVKYLNMGTHGHRALIPFDKPTAFWWESPSGKRMLAYRAEHYMHGNFFGIEQDDFENFEKKMLIYLSEIYEAGYPFDITSIQHSGYSTDNSPPSLKASELITKWNNKYDWPKIKTAAAYEFFEEIEEKHGNELEVYRAAWPDWWTDGFGSGAREVSKSRESHVDIIASQEALSMAKVLGQKMPKEIDERIFAVNDAILFYDEHTFGFHASIYNPYCMGSMEQRALKESYAWEAHRRARSVNEESMGLLQEYIPKLDVPSIAVFNTMAWKRSSCVKVYIDEQQLPRNKEFKIIDEQGDIMPAQVYEAHGGSAYWLVWVNDIPAFGCKQLRIEVNKDISRKEVELDKELVSTLENEWYKIEVDTEKGIVTSLFDKELNKELVDKNAPWKLGEIIYEKLDNRSELNKSHLAERRQEKGRKWMQKYERFGIDKFNFKGIEDKPIWKEMHFAGKMEMAAYGDEGFKLGIRLYNTTKRIDFVYNVVKKPITDPEAIYVAFPFMLEKGKIHFEVQGGVIEAGVDQIPGSSNDWNTVQNFVSVKNDDTQLVFGSPETALMQFGGINTGRYDAEAKPEKPYVIGWPMNNYWVTNFAVDQRGEFEWTYYFTSSSNVTNSFSTQFGWNARIPLLARVIPEGKTVVSEDFKSIFDEFPKNVLLINSKPLMDENAVIFHMRELDGNKTKFMVKGINIFQMQEVDVLGKSIKNINELELLPYETKFIKVKW